MGQWGIKGMAPSSLEMAGFDPWLPLGLPRNGGQPFKCKRPFANAREHPGPMAGTMAKARRLHACNFIVQGVLRIPREAFDHISLLDGAAVAVCDGGPDEIGNILVIRHTRESTSGRRPYIADTRVPTLASHLRS